MRDEQLKREIEQLESSLLDMKSKLLVKLEDCKITIKNIENDSQVMESIKPELQQLKNDRKLLEEWAIKVSVIKTDERENAQIKKVFDYVKGFKEMELNWEHKIEKTEQLLSDTKDTISEFQKMIDKLDRDIQRIQELKRLAGMIR